MRHYEIVFLVHPNQSEQVPGMVERYRAMIAEQNGKVHRLEDWGRRTLAYSLKKVKKAHYLLMNIECSQATLAEIENIFKFNDAVLRHMVVRRDFAIVDPSPMMGEDRTASAKEKMPRVTPEAKVEAAVTSEEQV